MPDKLDSVEHKPLVVANIAGCYEADEPTHEKKVVGEPKGGSENRTDWLNGVGRTACYL